MNLEYLQETVGKMHMETVKSILQSEGYVITDAPDGTHRNLLVHAVFSGEIDENRLFVKKVIHSHEVGGK